MFEAGNGIGKIIEIVANAEQAADKDQLFTMDGAIRTDGQDGDWSLTKTDSGAVVFEAQLEQDGEKILKQRAASSGR
ncbi:hypothetical protein [Agrobacterium tumefaciens]|uniref:hypothetical protein n=1 Tax=Agrobacterium tumefaciens TaxID=358 RepID=UPI00384E234F